MECMGHVPRAKLLGKQRANRAGFTLFELTLALMLMAVLSTLWMEQFFVSSTRMGEQQTLQQLERWRTWVTTVYREHIFQTEQQGLPGLSLMGQFYELSSNCQVLPNTWWQAWSRRLAWSQRVLEQDAYHQQWCVLGSVPRQIVERGVILQYRDFAVISGGPNQRVEQGSCSSRLSDQGELLLCGDDVGITVSGRQIAQQLLEQNQRALQHVRDLYLAYAQTRWQMNIARDLSIDYFANRGKSTERWDQSGAMLPSLPCEGWVDWTQRVEGQSHADRLGLSTREVIDAYGQVMRLDNCSESVRSPDHSSAERQLPPFTARVGIALPGGSWLIETLFFQES